MPCRACQEMRESVYQVVRGMTRRDPQVVRDAAIQFQRAANDKLFRRMSNEPPPPPKDQIR